jgi:hypothetical protein
MTDLVFFKGGNKNKQQGSEPKQDEKDTGYFLVYFSQSERMGKVRIIPTGKQADPESSLFQFHIL